MAMKHLVGPVTPDRVEYGGSSHDRIDYLRFVTSGADIAFRPRASWV